MKENNTELLQDVKLAVEESFKRAEAFFGSKIPRVKVRFDLKGKCAGKACFAKRWLNFNAVLAAENKQEFIKITVPHEVAHIVQRWKYGYGPGETSHSNNWKRIMVEVFRLPPKVTHKFDTSNVKRKTREYRYICSCVGDKKFHMVGAIKHKKMKFKKANYQCIRCGSTLSFEDMGAPKPKKLFEIELD